MQSNKLALINLRNPGSIEDLFLTSLGTLLGAPGKRLSVPKTFDGNFSAVEQQAVVGNTSYKFQSFANGNESFPESEHMYITHIKLYDAVSATLAASDWIQGVSDANLKNATITITNNGLREVKEMPLTDFVRSEEQNDSGTIELVKPIWWIAQSPLVVELNLPAVVATANTNLRIELSGMKLI